jgi:hypothetical protein
MPVYRWRGTAPNGEYKAGVWSCDDLPAEVKTRFDRGWRSLIVCAGDGPVPPPADPQDGLVAVIGPHPQTGKRTWWAEAADPAKGMKENWGE